MRLIGVVALLVLALAGCNPFEGDVATKTAGDCDAMATMWVASTDKPHQTEEQAARLCRRIRAQKFLYGSE